MCEKVVGFFATVNLNFDTTLSLMLCEVWGGQATPFKKLIPFAKENGGAKSCCTST